MASEQKAQIYAQLHWVYPFDHETEIKAKQTVTEIKRQHEVVDSFSEQRAALSNVDLVSERPRFLQKNKLTAAERGTIMHTIMQHLPFSKNLDYEAIHELVSQLIEREIVTKEQAVEIDLSLIFSFTRTPLFKRIVHANNVHREIPFTYTLPAFEGEGNDETYEKMLVQGVVDLIIEEEDGIVLIDYKTDAITERFANGFQEAKQVLLDRYEGQLTLYAEAITEIWKKRVKEKYLYFFDGNHTLQL